MATCSRSDRMTGTHLVFGRPRAGTGDRTGFRRRTSIAPSPRGHPRSTYLADFADERLTTPLRLRITASPGDPSTDIEIPLPEIRREPLDPFHDAFGLAMWSTITLPLPNGASEISIGFLTPAAGSIQILSLDTHQGVMIGRHHGDRPHHSTVAARLSSQRHPGTVHGPTRRSAGTASHVAMGCTHLNSPS